MHFVEEKLLFVGKEKFIIERQDTVASLIFFSITYIISIIQFFVVLVKKMACARAGRWCDCKTVGDYVSTRDLILNS